MMIVMSLALVVALLLAWSYWLAWAKMAVSYDRLRKKLEWRTGQKEPSIDDCLSSMSFRDLWKAMQRIGLCLLLAASALIACGGAPAEAPADPAVWRLGAPCSVAQPGTCGADPYGCALVEGKMLMCARFCDGDQCPAGARCQTTLGICLKECSDDLDCAPEAICNRVGACEPSCKVEPWICSGLCGRDGRCQ